MHLHILHIMQSKFIKTNPKETQSECVVSLWGGGGGEVGVAPIVVFVVYISVDSSDLRDMADGRSHFF